MNNDRVKILRMLEAGTVSIDEAARLIGALEDSLLPEDAPVQVGDIAHPPPVMMATPVVSARLAGFGRSFVSAFASSLDGVLSDGAQMDGTRILFCSLDRANLTDALLDGSWVVACDVSNANFEGANLRGARIICSDLSHADFRGANLEGVTILCSSLGKGDFRGADLRGKFLVCTSLPGINSRSNVVDLAVKK